MTVGVLYLFESYKGGDVMVFFIVVVAIFVFDSYYMGLFANQLMGEGIDFGRRFYVFFILISNTDIAGMGGGGVCYFEGGVWFVYKY